MDDLLVFMDNPSVEDIESLVCVVIHNINALHFVIMKIKNVLQELQPTLICT